MFILFLKSFGHASRIGYIGYIVVENRVNMNFSFFLHHINFVNGKFGKYENNEIVDRQFSFMYAVTCRDL